MLLCMRLCVVLQLKVMMGMFDVSDLSAMPLKALARSGNRNRLLDVKRCVSLLLWCTLVKMRLGRVVVSVVCVGLLLI